MSWFYRHFVRPVLFTQDPEVIHDYTMQALGWTSQRPMLRDVVASFFETPELPIKVFGLRFPNPIGLAAGMDKAAGAVPMWAALGFGFCELGAVTWLPQEGSPRPRLFRIKSEEAIINRMGFNNSGARTLAERLAAWRRQGHWPAHPVGINLGKSKDTPLAAAAEDYVRSFRVLWPCSDFFVVNVSSPNTPNLRRLQDRGALAEILSSLADAQQQLSEHTMADSTGQEVCGPVDQASVGLAAKPILVKVAPDLSFQALDQILELTDSHSVSGLIATNTTTFRRLTGNTEVDRLYAETGGLSGRPLQARSNEVIRHLYRQTDGKVPIIGVGGVFSADDAWQKIAAGASLIQVYTGLVYEGPTLVRDMMPGLLERLDQQGFSSLHQAVGCKAHSRQTSSVS